MMNRKTAKAIGATLTGLLVVKIASIVVQSAWRTKGNPSESYYQQMANEINKGMPVRLDEETVITGASYSDGRMTYSYQTDVAKAAAMDESHKVRFLAALKLEAVPEVCTKAETAKILQHISIGYRFYGRDKELIGEYVITPTDCADHKTWLELGAVPVDQND